MPVPTAAEDTTATPPWRSACEDAVLRGLLNWEVSPWQQVTTSSNCLTSVHWTVSLGGNTLVLQVPLPVTTNWTSTTFPAMWLPQQPLSGVVRPPRHAAEVERQTQEQLRRMQEERRRQMRAGEERALVLLRECLSVEQRAEFDADGHFHVRAGRRLFRLERRWSGNIIEVDPREPQRELAVYCAHPNNVPLADVLVAQKLFLEAGEDSVREMLAVANRHR